MCDLFDIKRTFEKMQFILSLLLLVALIGCISAYSGVDVSQRTSSSSFNCMVNSGYHFTVVRVYCSSGKVDSNGPASITDAWSGGMSYVDGYIFPCYSCGNPAKQVCFIYPGYQIIFIPLKFKFG